MKAIIFDIDGVVVKSGNEKEQLLKRILKKYDVLDVTWVPEIIALWLNRILILERISELKEFDTEAALKDLNEGHHIIESTPIPNNNAINFLKNNKGKYMIFSNTALPLSSLNTVINALKINEYFDELLAFDNGTKIENTEYVIQKYGIAPKDILFIEDTLNHIERVKTTWVNTLHFTDYSIDIEKEIEKY